MHLPPLRSPFAMPNRNTLSYSAPNRSYLQFAATLENPFRRTEDNGMPFSRLQKLSRKPNNKLLLPLSKNPAQWVLSKRSLKKCAPRRKGRKAHFTRLFKAFLTAKNAKITKRKMIFFRIRFTRRVNRILTKNPSVSFLFVPFVVSSAVFRISCFHSPDSRARRRR